MGNLKKKVLKALRMQDTNSLQLWSVPDLSFFVMGLRLSPDVCFLPNLKIVSCISCMENVQRRLLALAKYLEIYVMYFV